MIRAEKINQLPESVPYELSSYALQEICASENYVSCVRQQSHVTWELFSGSVFLGYAGLIQPTFLSENYFWCLPANITSKYTFRGYKKLAELLRIHYPGSVTFVESGWKEGKNLALFCGFIPTGEHRELLAGKVYTKYKGAL